MNDLKQRALEAGRRARVDAETANLSITRDPGYSLDYIDPDEAFLDACLKAMAEGAPELVREARSQAVQMADEDVLGTGNLLTALADALEAATQEMTDAREAFIEYKDMLNHIIDGIASEVSNIRHKIPSRQSAPRRRRRQNTSAPTRTPSPKIHPITNKPAPTK